MNDAFWQWVGIAVSSGALCAFFTNRTLGAWKARQNPDLPRQQHPQFAFLFDDGHLTTANTDGKQILKRAQGDTDWDKLVASLASRFPRLPTSHADLPAKGVILIESANPEDAYHLAIEALGRTVRVEVVKRAALSERDDQSTPTASTKPDELHLLRDVTNNAPYPIWKVTDEGREVWHNVPYERLYQDTFGHAPDPERPLFSNLALTTREASRQPVRSTGHGETAWYDISGFPQGGDHVFFAIEATSVVVAETTQRNFVQTLSKTFALLSTGLAIFDRQMQLVLFNPALVDLTTLPAEFLSSRPNLLSFFDRLRDGQIMPEPKDYASWREELSAMVAAASEGNYAETWTLPSGSTYQVTGRPHPDGAVAFLFEDISAEISLTRRFRADLELNQGILDEMPDAVAVFSATGVLTVTNAAYRRLWQVDPDQNLNETTIVDAMRDWQRVAGPNPLWGELRDFVLGRENRTIWTAELTIGKGRRYMCHVHPILNGATFVHVTSAQVMQSPDGTSHLALAK